MKKLFYLVASICITLTSYSQSNKEEIAIKALLEKESATWRAKDVTAHTTCWHIQPYSKMLVSTADGMVINVPLEKVVNPEPKNMGDGGTSINSNYTFSIHGNDAWVSHDELSTSPTGKQTTTSEIRILEKINGQWKLVGQSIMVHRQKMP